MKLKSNKQRRAEIKQQRLARAERLRAQLHQSPDARLHPVPGRVPADRALLAHHNNTYGLLPAFYLDRAFTCRDCGAEEVWTARQQQWWYEVMHAAIDSRAVRCLACRRARRGVIAGSQAHDGANLLANEGARLRALGDVQPTSEVRAQIDAALQSKWRGLRVLAVQVLGRWRDGESIARLKTFVELWPAAWGTWEYEASSAAAKALTDVLTPHASKRERLLAHHAKEVRTVAAHLWRQPAGGGSP